jgi:hypothetical protein
MIGPLSIVRPAYGTGSLADLLPSVSAVLGVPGAVDVLGLGDTLGDVDRIAVLLVDGLGAYQQEEVTRHAPVLADLNARTLTSGFPSTTPVSLATLGTGTAPGTHGILGFTVRKPDGPGAVAAGADALRDGRRRRGARHAGHPAFVPGERADRGVLPGGCLRGGCFVR